MKIVIYILRIILVAYPLICLILYFSQEKMIFFPQKLPAGYTFRFDQPFEELHYTTKDNTLLTGILFKADHSEGLIFYLHGNAGSLQSWGAIAKTYTDLHYDLFIPDYRGYGKSGGHIQNENQLHGDVQLLYDSLQQQYSEKKIIVLGYSIGTGLAAALAARNHPALLILQAPYFSLTDLVKQHLPMLPAFILKYKLETNKCLPACNMPVVIFHGDKDEVIYYGSSLKLQKLFKPADTLITLHNQGHNGMSDNQEYIQELKKILNR